VRRPHFAIAGLLALAGCVARGDVRLPAVFNHHMVLQQGLPVPVWGTAEPGEKVKVAFAGQELSAQAGADGRWKATLAPMGASGKPSTLAVTGKNVVAFTNVVVGEVWICSGQSNMAFKGAGVKDAEKEVPAANWPLIRLFNVALAEASERPREDVVGSWRECTPRAMSDFSGVGYFFGRELHRKLGVPVGLIDSARGGTSIEAWTRLARIEADPELRGGVDAYDARKDPEAEKRHYEVLLAKWEARAREAKAAGRPEPAKPRRVDPVTAPSRPGNLWAEMIAPLVPFAIRGVTWYQGEGNATRAERYARLFPVMIRDWREQWGQGDFPFLFVQIASVSDRFDHPTDHSWARLREAQLKTLGVSNTGMAVTVDIDNGNRSAPIHPADKKEVGRRLAAWALHDVYGKKEVVPSGPLFASMKVEGDRVRVAFTHVDGGLVARGEGGIKGFALAGEDRRFAWAEARIEGETVVLDSPQVKAPVAVRYGWAGNPEVSLDNAAGLPASPFRTDDWPFAR
jgi:sialate O-acetylesterase